MIVSWDDEIPNWPENKTCSSDQQANMLRCGHAMVAEHILYIHAGFFHIHGTFEEGPQGVGFEGHNQHAESVSVAG